MPGCAQVVACTTMASASKIISCKLAYSFCTQFIQMSYRCDPGFIGPDCVSEEPLQQTIIENVESRDYTGSKGLISLSGGGISNMCGVLASGEAAVFHQVKPIFENLFYFVKSYKQVDVTTRIAPIRTQTNENVTE